MCYSNNIPQMTFLNLNIDWDRIAKQKDKYKELDKFKQGDSGLMSYYPTPKEEYDSWKESQKPKPKTPNERIVELAESGEPFMLPNGDIAQWEDEHLKS